MTFHTEIHKKKSIAVVTISGRLDALNSRELRKEFKNLIEQTTHIVFDCGTLDYIDSSGLGVIVACLRKAVSAGGDLRLASLENRAKMVFELTRTEKLFGIYKNVEQALDSFSE